MERLKLATELRRVAMNPTNLLTQNPNKTWSYVGNVHGLLGYLTKDGKEPTPEQLENGRHVGPGIAGLKPQVWRTPYEAMMAAKRLGQPVTLSKWEMDKHPEIEEGLQKSKVRYKVQ